MFLLNLPNEIALCIFSHLDSKDKLTLKMTCTKLNYLITKAVLFEDLDLLKAQYRLEKDRYGYYKGGDLIIQKLINEQLDGSSVKVLHLNLDELNGPIPSQLSDLFPNVTRIITSKISRAPSFARLVGKSKSDIINPLAKWRNTIEKIITFYDWISLQVDLVYSKYPRLTMLDLNYVGDALYKLAKKDPLLFFTNAPLLASLTLRKAAITVDVLEAIHTGFPRLEELRLFEPHAVFQKDTASPPTIVLANMILFLELFYPRLFHTKSVVLDYIVKKYTNLQHLIFDVLPSDDYGIKTPDDFVGGFEGDVSAEIARSLSEFSILSAVESNFFSNLPNSLKALTLKINNVDIGVVSLAVSDSKITTLDLVDCDLNSKRTWKHPNMLEYLRKLTSLKTLKIELTLSLQSSTLNFISFSMTTLHVYLCGSSFGTDWILLMFPSLVKLYIDPALRHSYLSKLEIKELYYDTIRDTKEIRSAKVYSKLRFLSINDPSIHPEVFDFTKIAVPNLEYFNLTIHIPYRVWVDSTISYKYDMSSWNVNRCDISLVHPYPFLFIRCNITIANASKCILGETTHGSFELLDYDDKKRLDEISLEVILNHTTHLKILDLPIVKVGDYIVILPKGDNLLCI